MIKLFFIVLTLITAVLILYGEVGSNGCRYLKPVPHHPHTLACSKKP